MTAEDYSNILERACASLTSITQGVQIVGDGPSRFLIAGIGDRGVEFYAIDGGFIVDPAVGEELQGERSFRTFEEALSFASDWLRHRL